MTENKNINELQVHIDTINAWAAGHDDRAALVIVADHTSGEHGQGIGTVVGTDLCFVDMLAQIMHQQSDFRTKAMMALLASSANGENLGERFAKLQELL